MANRKKLLPVLLICSCLYLCAGGQIVNIETSRLQTDSTGWTGNLGASVSLTKNVDQIFQTEMDVHVQYKSAKSLYLILGSYGFLTGAGNKLIDNTFLHLRYNYKVTGILRWELFTQLQQNVITNIKSRFLLGTGPRFKIFSNKLIRLYAASLMMYEQEKENIYPNTLHNDLRSSSYVSFNITPNKQIEITSTGYFQPLIKDWNDFRFMNQTMIRVKAGKKLGLRLTWNYLNDSNPVNGIPSVNYTLSSGFDYDL